MRLLLRWQAVEPLELPLNYNQILQGVIYHNLVNDRGLSDFVHEEGYAYEQRRFRMFCFSRLFGKCKVQDKRIRFAEEVSMYVTSPDVYLIRTLADSIEKNGLCFGQQRYREVNVFLSDLEIEEEEIFVKAISPIVVYETDRETKRTNYFSPGEVQFQRALNENFQRKYEAYYGMPVTAGIEVVPAEVGTRDKCVTKYKGTYITGYTGGYRLRGRRQYLNFIYQTGLGSKNAQGFGMIELLD